MVTDALTIHDALASTRRFPVTGPNARVASWEIVALSCVGVTAALLTSYVKLRAGIPGHAIVLAVLPIALGVALVPRRFAGSIMSASSALTMLATGHAGLGAISSMIAIGLFLDLALRKIRPGPGLYAAFVLAGLGGNAVAWLVRAGTRLAEDGGIVALSGWWAHSLVSYTLCGAFAGLVSAALLFQLGEREAERA